MYNIKRLKFKHLLRYPRSFLKSFFRDNTYLKIKIIYLSHKKRHGNMAKKKTKRKKK